MAPRAEPPSSEWSKHEPIIRRLYLELDRPLPAVMRFMEENYGLRATEKVYKNRLKKAGVSKNINRSEALAMARVKAWRDARGVTSEFWRHGRLVEQARLHRFVHLHRQEFRKMVAEDRHRRADEPIEALLPPHIVVLSPCNPSAGVAARLDTTEKMFMGFRDYMMAGGPGSPRPSSQVSTLSGSSPSSSVLLRSGQETTELHFMWRQMERNMHMGIQTLRDNPVDGGKLLQAAFSLAHPLVSRADPWTLVPLLWRFSPVHEQFSWANRAPEVTRVLVDYIGQASVVIHGPDHPYSVIFQGFGSSIYHTDQQAGLNTMSAFWRVVCDVLEAQGRLNTMEYTLSYTSYVNAATGLAEPDPARRTPKLEAVWRSHVDRLRAYDTDRQNPLQAYLFSLEVVKMVASQGGMEEAHGLFEASLRTLDAGTEGTLRWLGYERLADMYERAGQAARAREAREKAGEAALAALNQPRTRIAENPERFMLEVLSAQSAPTGQLHPAIEAAPLAATSCSAQGNPESADCPGETVVTAELAELRNAPSSYTKNGSGAFDEHG